MFLGLCMKLYTNTATDRGHLQQPSNLEIRRRISNAQSFEQLQKSSTEPVSKVKRLFGTWRIPLGLWFALFAVSFNINMMTVLVVPITRALGAYVGSVQSVVVLFALVMAAFVPGSQGLSNLYGHWKIFFWGQAIFCLGLILTAFNSNVVLLVASYGIIAALGVTPMVTLPWTITNIAFPKHGRKRDIAFLTLGMAIVSGGLVGPFVGGFLTTASDWRWAFAPPLVMMVLIFLLVRPAEEIVRAPQTSVDVAGSLISFIGIVIILLGVNLANEFGWWAAKKPLFASLKIPVLPISIAPILVISGASILLFFVLRQRNRKKKKAISIWNFALFKEKIFALGLVTSGLYMIGTAGLTYCLYLYLQVVYDLTPFDAALVVSPYYLAMLAVLLATIWLGRYFLARNIVRTGFLLLVAGLWPLAQAISYNASPFWLAPGLAIMGTGAGLIISEMASFTQSRARFNQYGVSSGIYSAVQDLGYALGISIFGAWIVFRVSATATDGVLEALKINITPAERYAIVTEFEQSLQVLSKQELHAAIGNLPKEVQTALANVTLRSEITAMQQTLIGIAIVLSMAFAVSLFLPATRRFEDDE